MKSVIYLASKSPRRRELLSGLGFDVRVLADAAAPRGYMPDDELQHPGEAPERYVVRTAQEKFFEGLAARSALAQHSPAAFDPSAPVVAADTVVTSRGEVLGKPKDAEQARAFLRALSGAVHEVRTAVFAGFSKDSMRSAVSTSLVRMRPMTDAEVDAYIATGEPFDKAGGYGIQGLAGIFIDRIEGSYTGIMGLPVFETADILAELGVRAPFLCER